MSKNAGKTTVLNQIIDEYVNENIAITSIGLDGEKIDNVTNKPKPRIKVHKGMLIATAKDCLKECTFDYEFHEQTRISTALGNIVIIEATSEGLCLLAGPSTKTEMIKVIKLFKKYNPLNIFIDGALFRKSIAATTVSDAIVLSTGASYNSDVNIVVKDTKSLVDQLLIKTANKEVVSIFEEHKNNILIGLKGIVELGSLWDYDNHSIIEKSIELDTKYLVLKGALTNNIIKELIDVRHKIGSLTIVVKDSTHIVCDYNMFHKLIKMDINVEVMKNIELLFVSYNPFSPFGYEFNNNEFKEKLNKIIDHKLINVLKDSE